MMTISRSTMAWCRKYGLARSLCTAVSTKVCVVGSGPAGFYLTQHLLKQSPAQLTVDIFEKLPVPFGLVRFGVAPDHQDVKNVSHTFTKVATDQRVRFVGNVCVGRDVKLCELRQAYDIVVLAYGAAEDRLLGIPGESSLKNVISARKFVGWYNGHPDDCHLDVDLAAHDTAVIVGVGNVALDVARMLLTPVDQLRSTDITDEALHALSQSRIRHVHLVGRRGPMDVAFTIKEFREMLRLPGCRATFNQADFAGLSADRIESLPRPRRRLTQLMLQAALAQPDPTQLQPRSWHLHLFRRPSEVVSDASGLMRVAGIRLVGNQPEDGQPLSEVIECGLVLRSIGYKSLPLEQGLPYDAASGVIANLEGRVNKETGLYCTGWLATGPRGVIVDTMNDAFRVAETIIADLAKEGSRSQRPGFAAVSELLKARAVSWLTFDHWQALDAVEKQRGSEVGKPREKLTDVQSILTLLQSHLKDA